MNEGDLVRVGSIDQRGLDVSGMTGTLVSRSPLYADVALTCWPGVTVTVLRESLTLVNPVAVEPPAPRYPTPVIAAPKPPVVRVRKPKRKAPRIAIAPSETVYPPVVEPEPRPASRLRTKLDAIRGAA